MKRFSTSLSQTGFTYLGLLFLIMIMGIVAATAGNVWHLAQKREKEHELIFVGNQFRQAIGFYFEKTPGSASSKKQYPKTLDSLLQDNRNVFTQRYLRKIYWDPLTKSKEWGLVESPDGGIMGVYSLSEDVPLKQNNFKMADQDLEGKSKYTEWKFIYVPKQSSNAADAINNSGQQANSATAKPVFNRNQNQTTIPQGGFNNHN
ncbi:type II secretion system protein [Sulfurirhabdus autotrophica]|uniref:Type II secretory pathway pseudopilin PulG n=1 Tax=Sulfurirhabdus autotrophica TaxID=1706046 RepID=A0A4R3YC29_9PROT|nr:type II secretion system protein [Sulfurirhabdus autotrophica]TCV89530.1 type II secretory pathway pseudopilin PulG [Sulfurirhabdus autotrophica]